jgi:hypothetical protein
MKASLQLVRSSLAKALLLLATVGIAYVVSPTVAAESQAPGKRDCRTRGTTVDANPRVRVFYLASPGSRRYYGCDVRRRRARFIDEIGLGDGIQRRMALVGQHLAYESITCSREGRCSGKVYRDDLLTGRLAVVADLQKDAPPATDLAMTTALAVYWIRRTAVGYDVVRADIDGVGMLDSGPGVEPGSLVASKRRVYWTHDGQPRSHRD